MNRIWMLGRIKGAPKREIGDTGRAFVRFRLSVTGRPVRRDKQLTDTLTISVTCFGKTASAVFDSVKTGADVLVDGQLCLRRWETGEGKSHGSYEIVAQHVFFLKGPWDDPDEVAPGADWDIPISAEG